MGDVTEAEKDSLDGRFHAAMQRQLLPVIVDLLINQLIHPDIYFSAASRRSVIMSKI